ncbi:carbohydrate esterase family 4 protein [Ephemerocybe angulata]|uniref:Carbohydrate esterase family 4 protein n=1 Tax=Ephemerocybe angulata TaxID=980116 RepID=A0A8H6HC68_9AGAR|nr:carbohydrate esterase family 4 protein [Tulosesus angulatus]
MSASPHSGPEQACNARAILQAGVNFANAASPSPSSFDKRQAGKLITRCTIPNTVGMMSFCTALTSFISGSKAIVDTLKANNASATFFYNGNNYGCIYNEGPAGRVKYAYDGGMHIASHTWSHRDLPSMDRATSYGSYNDVVVDVSRQRGQAVVPWDFDSEDSRGATPEKSIQIYQDAINEHPTEIMALNHETYATTAKQIMPAILPKLNAAGYRVVDVATCLGMPKYQRVVAPSQRDSTWKC